MAAFHLLCTGKAAYKPTKGMEDRMHFIGPADKPLYACKKSEVQGLFDDTFWSIYDLWEDKHFGFGFADPAMYDPDVKMCIKQIERHWRQNFSELSILLKYKEAELRSKMKTNKKGRRK